MAVRTAYVPTAAAGITAANHVKFPGGWIGYAEVTSAQTGIGAGPTDITSVTLTVTAGTSRRLTIQVSSCVQQITSPGLIDLQIRNGAGTVFNRARMTTAATAIAQLEVTSVQTPSSGSNTYKASLGTSAGTVDTAASSTAPTFILVQDVGPSA